MSAGLMGGLLPVFVTEMVSSNLLPASRVL